MKYLKYLAKWSAPRREVSPRTLFEAIGWWEYHRIRYNVVVGMAGVLCGAILFLVGMINHFAFKTELGLPDPPLFAMIGMILYGFMSNVFYTGGWIAELIIRKISPSRSDNFAYCAYLYGLSFSVLLTLSPAILVVAFSLKNALSIIL